MKTKTFDYRKVPNYTIPRKRWIKRPMLQVALFNGAKRQQVVSLVDSGADDCLFHSSIGARLGITDLKSGIYKTYDGIAESVEAWLHPIQLQLQDFPERIDLMAGFTEAEDVYAILGQSGFFQNYKITFERYRGKVVVSERPEPMRTW